MIEERWKPIEGYEGYYEVSNTGKVRSVDRTITLKGNRGGEQRFYKGREIRPLQSQNHLNVHLQKQGQRENIAVGRLVARHFLNGFKESGKHQIKYLDGNTLNCSLDNLAYVDQHGDLITASTQINREDDNNYESPNV